jgi:hypothetical protein
MPLFETRPPADQDNGDFDSLQLGFLLNAEFKGIMTAKSSLFKTW